MCDDGPLRRNVRDGPRGLLTEEILQLEQHALHVTKRVEVVAEDLGHQAVTDGTLTVARRWAVAVVLGLSACWVPVDVGELVALVLSGHLPAAGLVGIDAVEHEESTVGAGAVRARRFGDDRRRLIVETLPDDAEWRTGLDQSSREVLAPPDALPGQMDSGVGQSSPEVSGPDPARPLPDDSLDVLIDRQRQVWLANGRNRDDALWRACGARFTEGCE